MDFTFEDHGFNKLIRKTGLTGTGFKAQIVKSIILVSVCWIPMAVFTALNGTFWTGDITNSFITSFDTQTRLLVSMPIFIISEKLISPKLGLILHQFIDAGIVNNKDREKFLQIIQKRTLFLKSHWTDLVILALCYIHVLVVLLYESTSTHLLSWQMNVVDGEHSLNFVGMWSTAIARPFLLFLFYRWILNIIVWGSILFRISQLDLNLFTIHPDLCGGLGFLAYSIRYFSPLSFAISVTVAGNIADFMLIEGMHLADLKYAIAGYFLIITLLFTLPLASFIRKLIDSREKSIFKNYDFANGMFKEFRKQISKSYGEVNMEDLGKPYYSSIADLNAVIENALKMKFIPFTLKDMIPIWVMAAIPFLGVVMIEVPVTELFRTVLSLIA